MHQIWHRVISWELFIFSEQYCDWRARASEAEGQDQLRNPNHNGAAPITVIHSPTTIIALDHSGCVKIGNIWFHLNQRNEYIYSCEQFAIYKYSIFQMSECLRSVFESLNNLAPKNNTNTFKQIYLKKKCHHFWHLRYRLKLILWFLFVFDIIRVLNIRIIFVSECVVILRQNDVFLS